MYEKSHFPDNQFFPNIKGIGFNGNLIGFTVLHDTCVESPAHWEYHQTALYIRITGPIENESQYHTYQGLIAEEGVKFNSGLFFSD